MILHQIIYFLEIKKTGKISVAAENLFVTQPTLTTAIKNLEQELGVKLFERNHDGLTLTEAGKAFDKHAVKILNEIEKTKKDMALWQPGRMEPLEISIPAVSCRMIYSLIYNDFKEKFPNINVTINDTFSYESIRRVVEEEHEIGFCIYNNEYPNLLNFIEFAQGEIMLLVQDGGKLSGYDTIPWKALTDELWLFNRRNNSKETATEMAVMENLKKHQLEISQINYVEDHNTIVTRVSMGAGIYPYPNTFDKNPFDNYQGVVSKPIEGGIFYRIGLIYKKGKYLSDSAKQFISWYKEIIEKTKAKQL